MISLADVNEAILDTLSGASGIQTVQQISGIKEHMPEADLPAIQCFPTQWSKVGGDTQQTTFGTFGSETPVQQYNVTYSVRVFVEPYAHIGQAMNRYVTIADALNAVFEQQTGAEPFGTAKIRSFVYEAEHVVFEYADQRIIGIQYQVNVRQF